LSINPNKAVIIPFTRKRNRKGFKELKTSQAELSELQRKACLGITGEMRTSPTAAIEVLLGLPPLHLQVEAEAKAGNYRLLGNDQWKPKYEDFGHEYMTQDMTEGPRPTDGV
jgi:hypothetical protein